MDIIDIANNEGKEICVYNSEDYMKLMKLAKRKGYKWSSGSSPECIRYDKEIGLPLLIGFHSEGNRKYLNFTENMGYSHIDYKYKRGNALW